MWTRLRLLRPVGALHRMPIRRTTPLLQKVRVKFITADGKDYTFEGNEGESIMEVGVRNNLDIEAACDGKCMCSTCHVYVDGGMFDKFPEPTDDEEDMLDLALERDDTSRLSCQLKLTKEVSGVTVTLPSSTANAIASPP